MARKLTQRPEIAAILGATSQTITTERPRAIDPNTGLEIITPEEIAKGAPLTDTTVTGPAPRKLTQRPEVAQILAPGAGPTQEQVAEAGQINEARRRALIAMQNRLSRRASGFGNLGGFGQTLGGLRLLTGM